jgi:hypothetical protein
MTMKRVNHKKRRPLQVRYYRLADTLPDFPDAYGHPTKEVGAIRGAMVRLFLGQYAVARVYDVKTQRMVFSIHRRPDGMPEVRYGKTVLGTVRPDGTIRYSFKG